MGLSGQCHILTTLPTKQHQPSIGIGKRNASPLLKIINYSYIKGNNPLYPWHNRLDRNVWPQAMAQLFTNWNIRQPFTSPLWNTEKCKYHQCLSYFVYLLYYKVLYFCHKHRILLKYDAYLAGFLLYYVPQCVAMCFRNCWYV